MRTVVVLAAFLAACGPGSDRGDDDGGGSGSGSGSGNMNTDGCSDAAKLVYVIDSDTTLSKFDPMTKTFTDLGKLSCPGVSILDQPFSMGVDRDAVAWVLYAPSAKLFRVDTTTLACTQSTFNGGANWPQFGMGFSSNTAGSTDDTLFIAGGPGDPMSSSTSALATMSTGSFAPMNVGTVTGWPELTGNGNAELWGWFPDDTAPRIEQINKTTGAPVKTYNLPMLAGTPMAWAFAFWGGDYWIFLEKSGQSSTTVYQVKGDTGVITTMTQTGTREIVGAGVSTCAPVVIL
jgi:hypothetical protein